ncbi:MAG: hypothetical protein LH624_18935, partial [Cryobacterium sp.]|nr:hypothetical protein [Cryobacterium sp.]
LLCQLTLTIWATQPTEMPERPTPNQSASEDRRVGDPVTELKLLVPLAITEARAIEHARRERNRELHRIRFFVDWGHNYPLWESFTDKYTMEPDDYGLSPQLGQRFNQWSRFWQQHFDKGLWLTTGDELVRLLEIEVYDIAVVLPRFRQGE